MKKILLSALILGATTLSACSSLPEGAKKLELNIESVSFADQNNVEGFLVNYTVSHHSLEPMPVEEVTIDVNLNGKNAASFKYEPKEPIEQRKVNSYSVFVPANHTYEVAKESLKYTPMLQLKTETTVNIIVDDDLDDHASTFNQTAKFVGIIRQNNN